jgi:predicted permease
MRSILFTLLIGVIAGGIDILPMVKMKLSKYAIASAFVFYFFVPYIIFNLYLLGIPWWIKGTIITPILALPVLLIVSQTDKKAIVPMLMNSIVLGTLIGIIGHFLNLSSV